MSLFRSSPTKRLQERRIAEAHKLAELSKQKQAAAATLGAGLKQATIN